MQWKPIDTAPRDGGFVLVFDADTEAPEIWVASWLEFDGDPDGGSWITADLCVLPGASYWMALPKRPNVFLTDKPVEGESCQSGQT